MTDNIDVLVIDDDPDYCELAVAALNACGQHKTLCLHDGKEALDYLHGTSNFDGRDVTQQPRLVLRTGFSNALFPSAWHPERGTRRV